MLQETRIEVTFGDCDPAGIVFYPNIFKWLDKTFHDWLRSMGGHAGVCHGLEAVGLGLFEATTQFRRPLCDGDILTISLSISGWSRKALALVYEGKVGEEVMFTARETRGLFKRNGDAMVAADIAPLREVVEAFDKGRE